MRTLPNHRWRRFAILVLLAVCSAAFAQEDTVLPIFHRISSHDLYSFVADLTSEEFQGRLTGTVGYERAVQYVVRLFEAWNIQPAGTEGYLQKFPNPYTEVMDSSYLCLLMVTGGDTIRKYYRFDTEFIPGSTSGSGEVTAEVVYAGYGITAPELGYDDYAGIDVKGKIVLIEREAPVGPDKDPAVFRKWRPYSFHQYKLLNAVRHGAAGMLYNYGPIANPNNAYDPGFVYSHVGPAVVKDLFAGTGVSHREVVESIRKNLKPRSFSLKKTVSMKNVTVHHPDGVGINVIGMLEGQDPKAREEYIAIGAHLDHVGMNPALMPGANDNASGVAVVLGVARALAELHQKQPLKRSVLFVLFGAEEQSVAGSKYFLKHPTVPLEKIRCFLNLDGVGCGDKIRIIAGKDFPQLLKTVERANSQYVHRFLRPTPFKNIARPRLDAARFLWYGIPTLSFSVFGGRSFYHNTRDDLSTIHPEILEDLARMLFLAVRDLASQKSLRFKKPVVLLSPEEIDYY